MGHHRWYVHRGCPQDKHHECNEDMHSWQQKTNMPQPMRKSDMCEWNLWYQRWWPDFPSSQAHTKYRTSVASNKDNLGKTVFCTTENDNLIAYSIEDLTFLHIIEKECFQDDANSCTTPLPFRHLRRRLPNDRDYAYNCLMSLWQTLEKKPDTKAHFPEFMQKNAWPWTCWACTTTQRGDRMLDRISPYLWSLSPPKTRTYSCGVWLIPVHSMVESHWMRCWFLVQIWITASLGCFSDSESSMWRWKLSNSHACMHTYINKMTHSFYIYWAAYRFVNYKINLISPLRVEYTCSSSSQIERVRNRQ